MVHSGGKAGKMFRPKDGQAGRQKGRQGFREPCEGVEEGWLAGNRAKMCWGYIEITLSTLAQCSHHKISDNLSLELWRDQGDK